MRTAAVGLVLATGCGGRECLEVECGFTHVAVHIVDADGEEGTASAVSYTYWPYDEEGELLDETELEEAGIDVTESFRANCTGDPDEGECPLWIAAAGFGLYTFTAVLKEDGTVVDTESGTADLPPPKSSKNKACCGLVASTELTLTLDADGSSDTGSGDDTAAVGTTDARTRRPPPARFCRNAPAAR